MVKGTTWPISELELELKRGSTSDLFAPARNLDHVKTQKIDVLSKSERGYALADSHEPTSFKAGHIELKPGMSAAEAFRTIAHACIRDFRLNETLLIASRAAEPLHLTRVAMRRLRSALSLFKPIVADRQYERLKSRLRHVSRQFGEARNLDVYIAHNTVPNAGLKGALPPVASDPAPQVQIERNRAYECVISTLQSKRFRQCMQDLVAWIEAGPWCAHDEPKKRTMRNQTIEYFAAHVLGRSRRKLKRDGRHLDRLSPKKRHHIRIAAKKLRYASEFFSGLFADRQHRRRRKAFIIALKNLQTCLGDLNDIQTGHEIAAELERPKTAPTSRSDAAPSETNKLDEDDKALLRSACNAHHRLSYAKPFWES